MVKTLLVVAFVLVPSLGQAQGLKLPAGLFVGAQVADLWTTHAAVRSGRGVEGNPLMGNGVGAVPVVVKTVTTAGVLLGARHLATHGHPTAARVVLYTLAGVTGAVALHNARIAKGR